MKDLTFIKLYNNWLSTKIFCKNAKGETLQKILKTRIL